VNELCRAAEVYDGLGRLHLAVTNEYDVIVLDIGLAGMDGLTLRRRLREDERSGTPILKRDMSIARHPPSPFGLPLKASAFATCPPNKTARQAAWPGLAYNSLS
jgi:CheY-like chemotaxis protein